MGFFDKLKNFGSKVIKGIGRGIGWVRDKVAPIVKKAWQIGKPIADAVFPGSKPVTDAIGHFGSKIGGLIGVK